MPIQVEKIVAASTRRTASRTARTLQEARQRGYQTAFVCHSHADQPLALGLQQLLKENGWDLYVDWEATEMPERPTGASAERIKEKITQADWFIFLATAHLSKSRWCSWALGYAEAIKDRDRILVAAISDNGGTYGGDYVDLYPRISKVSKQEKYAFFGVASLNGTLVERLRP